MSRTKLLALLPLAGAIALFTACRPPKILINDVFVPGHNKVARYSVKPLATTQKGETTLSNYYIQICDIQGREASNCKTTLVLENITNYYFARPRLPM